MGEMKAVLRATLRERLRTLTDAEREAGSERICARVRSLEEWGGARTLLGYVPMRGEVDIRPLLEEWLEGGHPLYLPAWEADRGRYGVRQVRNLEEDLVVGPSRVREPGPGCSPGEVHTLDFALVPGLGFDTLGARLGRGGGHYDRLLAGFGGCACGVAFEVQVMMTLPREAHDRILNRVVTPERVLSGLGAR